TWRRPAARSGSRSRSPAAPRAARSASVADHQEVDAQGREAADEQQRVRAQEARLRAADDAAGAADDAAGAGDDPVDHEALEDRVAKAPDRDRRPVDQPVDQLVEVPLV